jgi:hypothetical protein
MEQSKTIFVGNVTAVTPVDVQYPSQWTRNGTMKQSVDPETMTLDEYTVHIEEFLKNPQNYSTIKLRQATVSGVPTGPAKIGGFEVGDRVLFYLPKYENQTHFPMQYLPESFKIPQFCDGQDLLTQKRIEGSNSFTVIQNGIEVDYGNFTANKPIKFLIGKDMNTLFGKNFDVMVGISKVTDKGIRPLFSQTIHAGLKPCQWTTSAEWEFTPTEEGQYTMDILTKEGTDIGGMSHTVFSVKSDWESTNVSVGNSNEPVQNFNIQYRIFNGTSTFQAHNYAFTANTYSNTDGTFEIKIPRNFPYYNGKDGPSNVETYVVIENGVQLTPNQYTKSVSDCFFDYSVPFHTNSTITITSMDELSLVTPIYGDKVADNCMPETMVPEFPLVQVVLVVSIVSVISFYRIVFRK